MTRTPIGRALLCFVLSATAAAGQPATKAVPVKPDEAQRRAVVARTAELSAAIDGLAKRGVPADRLADVEIYRKAALMMERLDEYARPGEAATVLDQLATGLSRARSLAQGEAPWTTIGGAVVRGYRSKVDGSVQPYAVEVPSRLDRKAPARLDVVLHGRDAGLNESRFIKAHEGRKVPDDRPGLTLHVFGRTNNAYRWAGESDVFEAIEAVGRNNRVDDTRVVLKGFSMGGAGAWHIGLHHPSLWSSVEAGAGFVDTLGHARLDRASLPLWRQKAMTIYDSVDYALNATDVPIIAYGGEDDPQLRASTLMVDALKALGIGIKTDGLVARAEGIDFTRVIGKAMGHKVDPASRALMDAFHDEHAKAGLNRTPATIRFVTYTLAYNRAAWLSVERLREHYTRATVEAELKGEIATIKTENVAMLAVDRQVAATAVIDGAELPLRLAAKGLLPRVYYRRSAEGWEVLDHEPSLAHMEGFDGFKNPSVHGPIDDAFRGPFLAVTPTGTPWHPEVDAWAKGRLARFSAEFERSMRGSVRTVRDVDVTERDVAENHLIVFGDPGSNAFLGRIVKGLPIAWTKETVTLGATHDAARHVPVLIAPNPLNPRRYVVVNSGHTFEPSDFAGTNALLFPRLGDYAVIRLGGDPAGEVLTSGFFDERWRPR